MSKINFNDHLDDMMERLMNEDLTTEQLENEVRRSKALCQIADKKIENNKLIIQAAKMLSNGDIDKKFISEDIVPGSQSLLKS
jgi:hypothetical protein